MKVIEHLINAVRTAAVFNPDVQTAPASILWPDHERQWEGVINRLQGELPELFILGDYDPAKRTGPGIWLRCVIAGKIEDTVLPDNLIPIIYLPGVSRQDMRVVENCSNDLKPLIELQYRGVIWSQKNSRDWSMLAFMKSSHGGLGLDVAQDKSTLKAMQLALHRLLDEEVDLLNSRHLDKDYFNTLLSTDPIRDLLQWLDMGESFRTGREDNEWRAFVEVCKSKLGFDPANDGPLAGAARLAGRKPPWGLVWERFCEASKQYSNIPVIIRQVQMPKITTLYPNASSHGGWPQWNEEEENNLRKSLIQLKDMAPHEVRKRIVKLENMHMERRKLVWCELGESPLASAMEYLSIMAEKTSKSLTAGTIDDLTDSYSNSGWQADNALLQALACVEKQENFDAVTAAIRSMYLPWAEESAHYLQKLIGQSKYPGVCLKNKSPLKKSECIIFVDGLRFDVARKLSEILMQKNLQVEEKACWAALPSVTATGKPAVTPVSNMICGLNITNDFEPSVAETGKSLKGGYHLKKLLTSDGWNILERTETGDESDYAWCEFGDIDHEGHNRGWKLARYLDSMVREIAERIEQLINAGWERIRIVTDHGWLLLPGGLPKVNLLSSLTENKWGRCAVIKSGAVSDETLFPWYWNPEQSFALASGISCYRSGEEYAHGGLSLQECLNLELTVSLSSEQIKLSAEITDITWKGLRCNVAVNGVFTNLSIDVRLQAGNPASSVVMVIKKIKENGSGSVVVEDDDLENTEATIVLIDSNSQVVAQVSTVIGGGEQ